MKLIAVDDVIALLANHHFDNDKGNFDLLIHNLCKEVKDIPAAYDIDAVMAQLETDGKNTDVCISKKRAIEIIKAGGVNG
jgi:hypothetical protein